MPLLYGAGALSQRHWETGKAKAGNELRVRISACFAGFRLRATAGESMERALVLFALALRLRSFLLACNGSIPGRFFVEWRLRRRRSRFGGTAEEERFATESILNGKYIHGKCEILHECDGEIILIM